ncbi:lantibiotic dehydratase family protein [Streptomyces huiliensis]|uniref:lantibiotic dehydratase family protein n=1 Tax=Streptomyces huiliensis TaxID=2876027 RepID=UPI001CBF8966|nr:lantibiotic dehydratase family protein [Streptomyces huiliensis]MBZ4319926.1 lantibiotic dehydratase family protein [Streptomyces huiliensis]
MTAAAAAATGRDTGPDPAAPPPGRPPQDVHIAGTVSFGARALEWELVPWALLRTPGFPVDGVAGLADPELVAADDRLAELRAARETARRELTDELGRHVTGQSAAGLRTVRRAVAAGRPVPEPALTTWADAGLDTAFPARWNTLTGEIAAAEHELTERYAEAHARSGHRIAELCRDPRFQHAVYLSSQSFFHHGLPRVLTGTEETVRQDRPTRKALATAARYLRRLSVRCEQTSFFGPTYFVHLDPALDRTLLLGPPDHRRTYAEPGIWLLELLADLDYRSTPAEQRRPRRHPLFRPEQDRLTSALDGRFRRASREALALWLALDGEHTLAQACAAAGVPTAEADRLLAELGPTVIRRTPVASHALHPLEQLVAAEADAAGPAHRIAEAVRTFGTTPWPDRRTAFEAAEALVTGLGARTRQGEGQHYVDRYVLHEECAHPLSARTALGAPTVDGITSALRAVLPLSYLGALVAREDAREALRQATGGRRTPLARAGSLRLPPVTRRRDALTADLAALVTERARASGIAQLTSSDVEALIHRHCPPLDPADHFATVAGPDLMAMGPLDEATWVLSELHDDGSYVAGAVTRLHPDGAGLRADFERRTVSVIDPDGMAAVVSRRRNKFLVPEMPGLSIEVGGYSSKPRTQTVPLSEADIAEDGTALHVDGRRLRLYSGDIPSDVHRALAVPALNPVVIDTGDHTPRICVDGTVVQRARRRLRLAGGLRGYDGWSAAQRLRRDAALPQRVFVRHPAEPKPLFVDFADLYAVADLMRLPAAEVVVTEMLPDYAGLWWRPHGEPVCAELRTSCLVRLAPTPKDVPRTTAP